MRGLLSVVLLVLLSGCTQYRLIRPDEVTIPDYQPREVLVPERCDALITRAAAQGMGGFSETEAREVSFCQNQQMVRAQEEEAAMKRLEAHAQTAEFALRATALAVGALIAVLAWVF